jgi:hypothetical protein
LQNSQLQVFSGFDFRTHCCFVSGYEPFDQEYSSNSEKNASNCCTNYHVTVNKIRQKNIRVTQLAIPTIASLESGGDDPRIVPVQGEGSTLIRAEAEELLYEI